MKQTIQPCAASVTPVRWFKEEATLRAYLAQRDHCLWLYDRARFQGFYGRAAEVRQSAVLKGKGTSLPSAATDGHEPGSSL
jgi:hypothetical protein